MTQIRRFGDYEIDHRLFQIRRAGEVVPVERRVFDVIAYLLANSDRVVSKEELLREIWQGRSVSSGSLTVAITAARQAFRDDSGRPQVIITHRGRGYRFHLPSDESGQHDRVETGAPSVRSPFVGRQGEIGALREMLRDAAVGRAAFACVSGDPGIGKTRLTEEFATIARSAGALVAAGRCREEDGAPPFWPWIQIARSLCEDALIRSEADVLANDAPEIAQLVPELGSSLGNRSQDLPAANARFRLFDGFSRFVTRASRERCLVLVLDDVHRADRSSLLLLQFLLREAREARILVLATHRPLMLRQSHEQFEQLAVIAREAAPRVLQLSGLSSLEIGRLIRVSSGRSPTGEEVSSLEELTGGNPFFITQIVPFLHRDGTNLKATAGALPATVRDAIARQIEMLTPEVVLVLKAAAVVGREFESWVIERLTTRASPDLSAVWLEAVSAGVISSIDDLRGSWRFVHALVRDVLYQDLDPAERSLVHARIGELLEESPAVRSERLEEITSHYVQAVDVCGPDRAISLCTEAASVASAALAYEKAVEHYAIALQLLEGHQPHRSEKLCSVLVRLGEEQVRCGDRDAAKRTLDRAGRIAEAIGSPELIAEAALGVAPGFFTVEAGVRDEFLISILRRALAGLGSGHETWRAMVSARLAIALVWSDDTGEPAALTREATRIAASTGNPSLKLVALLARWLAEWSPYGVDERREIAQEAVSIARRLGSKEALVVALLYRCVGELEAGEIAAFDQSLEEFRSNAAALRQPQALWYARLLGATRALHSGRFLQAAEDVAGYFEIGRRVGDANAFHSKMAQGLLHAAERGDYAEMLSISEEARRRYPIFLGWRASRIWALARADQIDVAQRGLDELLGLDLAMCPRKLDWPTALAVIGESARLLQRPDAAETVYELLLPLKGRTLVLGFCVMTWGPVSRYLGIACETMGRLEEAEMWLKQAVDESARSEGFAWLAHAEVDMSRVWGIRGRPEQEIRRLRMNALRRANSLGMSQLSREIAADR